MRRAMSQETLVETRSSNELQIVRKTWRSSCFCFCFRGPVPFGRSMNLPDSLSLSGSQGGARPLGSRAQTVAGGDPQLSCFPLSQIGFDTGRYTCEAHFLDLNRSVGFTSLKTLRSGVPVKWDNNKNRRDERDCRDDKDRHENDRDWRDNDKYRRDNRDCHDDRGRCKNDRDRRVKNSCDDWDRRRCAWPHLS